MGMGLAVKIEAAVPLLNNVLSQLLCDSILFRVWGFQQESKELDCPELRLRNQVLENSLLGQTFYCQAA